jgi:hypothetical protein
MQKTVRPHLAKSVLLVTPGIRTVRVCEVIAGKEIDCKASKKTGILVLYSGILYGRGREREPDFGGLYPSRTGYVRYPLLPSPLTPVSRLQLAEISQHSNNYFKVSASPVPEAIR